MRKILFKAKRIDNGEWVEGFLFQLSCEGGFNWCIGNEPLAPNDYSELCGADRDWFYVDENTICQFTGLTDKNGNKIWENDVVKMIYYDNYFEHGVVRYYEQDVRYRFCTESDSFSFDNTDTLEVIGNIFDNPELLEGGAE